MCKKLSLTLRDDQGKVLYETTLLTEPGKEGGVVRLLDSVLEENFVDNEEEV